MDFLACFEFLTEGVFWGTGSMVLWVWCWCFWVFLGVSDLFLSLLFSSIPSPYSSPFSLLPPPSSLLPPNHKPAPKTPYPDEKNRNPKHLHV